MKGKTLVLRNGKPMRTSLAPMVKRAHKQYIGSVAQKVVDMQRRGVKPKLLPNPNKKPQVNLKVPR